MTAEPGRSASALRAVVYLPTPGSAALALRPVVGRPLVLRVIVAAARAGAVSVAVPRALRTPALECHVARLPALRERVQWLEAGAPAPAGRCLLLPAAAQITAATLQDLVDSAGHALVLEGTREAGAPVLLAPPETVLAHWPVLAAGEPAGERLAAAADGLGTRAAAQPVLLAHDEAAVARIERSLYDSLTSGEDTSIDRNVHRRLSLPLTRLLVRTPLTPNQVSLMSLAVGLTAIWSSWHATAASAGVALVLYGVATVIDHCDGELARLTFRESPLGAQLDWVIDTIIHAGLVLGIGVSAGGALGAGLGVLGAAGVTMSAFLARYLPDEWKAHSASPDRVLKDMGNRDLFYAVLLAFVHLRWAWPAGLLALALVVALGSQSYWLACFGRVRASRIRHLA